MAARAPFIRRRAAPSAIGLVAGSVNTASAATSVSLSVQPDGSANQLLLLMLQHTSTANLLSVKASTVDMELITGTVSFQMLLYGLMLGSSSALQSIVVTGVSSRDWLAHASVWRGIDQASVATSVFAEASTTSLQNTQPTYTASVGVGNMMVAHVMTGPGRYGTVDGTELFDQAWSTRNGGAAYMLGTAASQTINFANTATGVGASTQGCCLRAG